MESVLRSITQDKELIKGWSDSLQNYTYIDNDPELGVYSRYIDLREYPPILKTGGIIVDYTDSLIKFKIGWPKPHFWTIQRDFYAVFQMRSFRVDLIKLAQQTISEKLGTDE